MTHQPTIYLSGPISNIAEGNEPLFRLYEMKLKTMGYHVIVPHDLLPNFDYSLQELLSKKDWDAYVWRMYMDLCVPKVVESQAVCVLPGWSASDGAMCEVQLAIGMKIPYFNCNAMPPVEELDLSHDIKYKHEMGLIV